MAPMRSPACCTATLPPSMVVTDVAISVLISLAACAERCARVRTSEATTAKPRPCSPARAASTAAFRARMLVWKEIPSITPIMSTIWRELARMVAIVATACCIAVPPCTARSDACAARSQASWALLALSLTASVRVSMALDVSSSELACISVRADKSRLPLAISCEAVSIDCTASMMVRSVWFKLAMVWSSTRDVSAISSLPCLGAPAVSLPAARSCTASAMPRISASMARRTSMVTTMDSTMDNSTVSSKLQPRLRNSALAVACAWLLRVVSSADSCASCALNWTNCVSALSMELVAID
ncbi:hypothetical protein JaAD80_21510 [Janthinobacterium sp. AD80]|nr:hypothetical protein JaAD80_21510 [Janthinobacterium sp. AD80]